MENAQPEQSMEEILASIRRIISEDEDDGDAPGAASRSETGRNETGRTAAMRQEPAAQERPREPARERPAPEARRPEVVMTEDPAPVAEDRPQQAGEPSAADTPASSATSSSASAPSVSAPSAGHAAAAPDEAPSQTESLEMLKKNVEAGASETEEALILDQTAAAAASQAFENLSQSVRVADKDSRTLEDIVVAMLKPMIKDWLDANLPAIVEEKVEQEVQRVSRRRG